jgi:hypothetical protein
MFVRLLISVKDEEVDWGQDEWWIKSFFEVSGMFLCENHSRSVARRQRSYVGKADFRPVETANGRSFHRVFACENYFGFFLLFHSLIPSTFDPKILKETCKNHSRKNLKVPRMMSSKLYYIFGVNISFSVISFLSISNWNSLIFKDVFILFCHVHILLMKTRIRAIFIACK